MDVTSRLSELLGPPEQEKLLGKPTCGKRRFGFPVVASPKRFKSFLSCEKYVITLKALRRGES